MNPVKVQEFKKEGIVELSGEFELGWLDMRDIKARLKDKKFDHIILNCLNLFHIDSSIVGLMLGYHKEGKKVTFKVNKESHLRNALFTYGLHHVVDIEEYDKK
ncbi:MAG TPA: hypothetical protein P5136_02780 [Methanofastidiosum sp.]|nr:hypothetical protein [Methanofastidiosum sp.]